MTTTYELVSALPLDDRQQVLTVRVTKDGVTREGSGTVAADADLTVMGECVGASVEAQLDAEALPAPPPEPLPVPVDVSKVRLDPVRAKRDNKVRIDQPSRLVV